MKVTHLISSLVLSLVLVLGSMSAQAAPSKDKLVRDLFKVLKTEQIGEQVKGQMIEMLSQEIPADKRKKLEETVNKETKVSELLDLLVPVYDQSFTQKELEEIIAFYNTPTGQKYVSSQPRLIGESSQIIQKWAIKYSEKVKDKMGIKKK